jgi:hypothetical protein
MKVTGRGYMWGENPSLVELWGRTGDQSPRVFIPLNINVGVLESKRIKTLLGGVYFSCALTSSASSHLLFTNPLYNLVFVSLSLCLVVIRS